MTEIKENKLIVKSNELIEAAYKASLQEMRVIKVFISMIKKGDKDFNPYQMSIKDFQGAIGSDNKDGYDRIREVIRSLRARELIIKQAEGGELITSWFSSAEYLPKKGKIEINFDPKLKPHLLDLREKYKAYRLKNVLKLRSAYAIRIYELLKQYESTGERTFLVEDLKYVLGIEKNKYKLYADFKRFILNPAQKDIKKQTDISFDFKEKKHGHKIIELLFKIKSQEINTVEPEPEASAGDEIEIKNIELNKKLQEYYRLSPKQAKWMLVEYDKDPDRVLQNLEYVAARYKKGEIKNIGPYTMKAIRENYSDQPSLFDVEKNNQKIELASKKAQEEAQESHIREYESYLRDEIAKFQKTLSEAEIEQIHEKTIMDVETRLKRNKPGFNRQVEIVKRNHFKQLLALPEFEEWVGRATQ